MHHLVANNSKGFRQSLKAAWPWIAEKLITYQVGVLMGDINMSLFKTTSELRSCGVKADLAAWYPWKAKGGHQPFSVVRFHAELM